MEEQYIIYVVCTYSDGPQEAFLTEDTAKDYIKSMKQYDADFHPDKDEDDRYISKILLNWESH